MEHHLREQRGLQPEEAASLLAVVDSNGTSDPGVTIADIVRSNRAGPDDNALSLEQIIEQYG
jgi:hypothetical protein